jgi:hypothetical protein
MLAYVRVLDNPYFAVTGDDGSYKIDTRGLPDGEYELVFWQEKYLEKTEKVNLKDGKADVNFSYDADAKSEAPSSNPVKLASLTHKAEAECCEAPAKQAPTVAAASK